MKYIERFLTIIILPFKALLKLLAIIGFVLLLILHFLVFFVTIIPIFIIQVVENITVVPLYYIFTGKNYKLKYNTFCEMAIDLLFLERPYHLKEKQKREKKFYFYTYDVSDNEDNDPYSRLWRKIKNINLKLNYE